MSFVLDVLKGIVIGLKHSKQHVIDNYVKVPIGITITLLILYGVNEIILLIGINFPSSVACMLLADLILIIGLIVMGPDKTQRYVMKYLEIPGAFGLKWMNIFFTPAFIVLPLSSWISAKEALTIVGVFIFGYLLTMAIIAYFSVLIQWLIRHLCRRQKREDVESKVDGVEEMVDLRRDLNGDDGGVENPKELDSGNSSSTIDIARSNNGSDNDILKKKDRVSIDIHPTPLKDTAQSDDLNNQVDETDSTKKKTANFVTKNFDYMILSIVFIIGIPLYYSKLSYPLFLHLSISISTFLIMIKVPPVKWRIYLHPVICSVAISWLLIYIFSLIKKDSFLHSIHQFKTGRNYLKLFNHRRDDKWPGAGDVFSTLMDVSIVSLSIPMYTYRKDLKDHFITLLPSVLLMSFGSFFIYPPLCYKMGISSERSLAFAGRSVTLALGSPFVKALNGSVPLMAVTTVVSGLTGALLGQFILTKLLRIKKDDYVTRGITLGCNSSALATASLLTSDPRAAAISSLSFVLFGTLMVILSSITPLAKILRNLTSG